MATNVSHEGYADSTFLVRAQDSAIAMASAVLSEIVPETTEDSAALAEVLAVLGDYSFRKRGFADAADYWLRAGQALKSLPAAISLRPCLLVLSGHGEVLDSPFATKLESLVSRLRDDCPADSLIQLWTLAHLCEGMWLWVDARSLHERVVAVFGSQPAADARWAIRSLVTLGEMTSKRIGIPHATNPAALQDSAIALAQHAITIARTRFGTSDTMFAYVADRLGDYYSRVGKQDAACALWDSAWAANRLHLPPTHIEYQGNLDRMSAVYRAQGRYLDAETLGKQALELRKQTRGEGHPEVASMYVNLGRTYHATGKFRQAEMCYREALRIRESALERSEPLIADSYRKLGQLYFDDGRYALADRHYRKAIELMRGALGEQHAWVAACMRDLSTMYVTWGRPEESIGVLRDALDIQIRFLGDLHPAVASILEDIARTELLLGHTDRALAAIDQAGRIDSAVTSAGGVRQRSIVTTRARVLLAAGLPSRAESLLTARPPFADSQAPNLHELEHLSLLAQAYDKLRNVEAAQATYDRIFNQASDVSFGTIALADIRDQYAEYLLKRGLPDAALNVSVQSLKTRLNILDEAGQVLSEHQALQAELAMHRSRDILLSALIDGADYAALNPTGSADLLLASKGAVSNSVFERERELRRSADPTLQTIRDSLHVTRHRMATIYMRGLANAEHDRSDRTLDSLRATKGRLEAILARELGNDDQPHTTVRGLTAAIRQGIPPDGTLIEYFRYQAAGHGDSARYAALLISQNDSITLRDLADAHTVDSLTGDYAALMAAIGQSGAAPSEHDLNVYHRVSDRLFSLLVEPFVPILPRNATIVIAPDAELHLVSFAGLTDGDGHYMIENWPVHYLTCGRSLLEPRTPIANDGALIVCDPDFNADSRARRLTDGAALLVASQIPERQDFVTLRSSCESFSRRRFTRLPGTRDEAETVRGQLTDAGLGAVEILAGAASSEENLKRNCASHRLLHLATHGFYLSADCGNVSPRLYEGRYASLVGENPLLLSGVCLAGANRPDDSTASDDGILTAEEVASLPLDGTQWVVLSACETQLGERRHGEGVFGLQRAFQMAGANTVISALWSIPDRATVSFMRSLYAGSGQPLYESMRQSQIAAIAELRRRGQPDHPFNWAGFIAVGAWKPLY